VSRHQKGKNQSGFTGARDSEWQWHQLGHLQICTLTQIHNEASDQSMSGNALILHARENMRFLHFSISSGSAETLVRRGWITNHYLTAYSPSNISAKNYQNQLVCIEVLGCDISVIFWDTVYLPVNLLINCQKLFKI